MINLRFVYYKISLYPNVNNVSMPIENYVNESAIDGVNICLNSSQMCVYSTVKEGK